MTGSVGECEHGYMSKYPHYDAIWRKKRRDAYFCDKQCVECGLRDQLELDHIDQSTKFHNNIWSWRKERQVAELAKCRVLCHTCHTKRSATQNSIAFTGKINHAQRKLSNEQVTEIKKLLARGIPQREIAPMFNISRPVIQAINVGRSYVATVARTKKPHYSLKGFISSSYNGSIPGSEPGDGGSNPSLEAKF